jgi:HAMP domain-containing protein
MRSSLKRRSAWLVDSGVNRPSRSMADLKTPDANQTPRLLMNREILPRRQLHIEEVTAPDLEARTREEVNRLSPTVGGCSAPTRRNVGKGMCGWSACFSIGTKGGEYGRKAADHVSESRAVADR